MKSCNQQEQLERLDVADKLKMHESRAEAAGDDNSLSINAMATMTTLNVVKRATSSVEDQSLELQSV